MSELFKLLDELFSLGYIRSYTFKRPEYKGYYASLYIDNIGWYRNEETNWYEYIINDERFIELLKRINTNTFNNIIMNYEIKQRKGRKMRIETTGNQTIIIRDTSENSKNVYIIRSKKGPKWAVQYNIKNIRFQFYFYDRDEAIRARNVIDARMPRIKACTSRDEMMAVIMEPVTLFAISK